MTSKRPHDTQELYINEVNWQEIRRRTKIAFKVSFIFLFILVLAIVFIATNIETAINIHIYMAIFLGIPMIVVSYRINPSKWVSSRLFILLSVAFIIGLLIALATGEALFVIFALTTLIPVMHLINYKDAKVSKYIWGGSSAILGAILSAGLVIVSMKLGEFLDALMILGLSRLGYPVLIVYSMAIVLPVGSIVAFYWLFISFAEEIYRIKYESND